MSTCFIDVASLRSLSCPSRVCFCSKGFAFLSIQSIVFCKWENTIFLLRAGTSKPGASSTKLPPPPSSSPAGFFVPSKFQCLEAKPNHPSYESMHFSRVCTCTENAGSSKLLGSCVGLPPFLQHHSFLSKPGKLRWRIAPASAGGQCCVPPGQTEWRQQCGRESLLLSPWPTFAMASPRQGALVSGWLAAAEHHDWISQHFCSLKNSLPVFPVLFPQSKPHIDTTAISSRKEKRGAVYFFPFQG